jgi:hypothetical protein
MFQDLLESWNALVEGRSKNQQRAGQLAMAKSYMKQQRTHGGKDVDSITKKMRPHTGKFIKDSPRETDRERSGPYIRGQGVTRIKPGQDNTGRKLTPKERKVGRVREVGSRISPLTPKSQSSDGAGVVGAKKYGGMRSGGKPWTPAHQGRMDVLKRRPKLPG